MPVFNSRTYICTMKKISKIISGALAISILAAAVSSCKKKKDESPRALLSGKWKTAQTGYDENNNSVMEATEVVSIGDSISLYMAFGSDGSGTLTVGFLGTEISSPFSWNLANNDKTLHVKTPATTYSAATDADLTINTLTSSDLVVRDTTDMSSTGYASWTVFKKL